MTVQITTEEPDRFVGDGTNITKLIDLDAASQSVCEPNTTRCVSVDFPSWMVIDLDSEASRLAIERQEVIKILVDEGLRARRNLRAS